MMKPLYKGLLLAALHLALVASLGAKLLYDRATRPRVWARAAPYDPSLPIRGRYVSLQVEVHALGIEPPQEHERGWRRVPVVLLVEDGRLVARRDAATPEYAAYREDANVVVFRTFRESQTAVLAQPVLYFIPEHIPDPSRRGQDEELWVELTLPKKGPPRPIRLGVKKADGPLTPLELD